MTNGANIGRFMQREIRDCDVAPVEIAGARSPVVTGSVYYKSRPPRTLLLAHRGSDSAGALAIVAIERDREKRVCPRRERIDRGQLGGVSRLSVSASCVTSRYVTQRSSGCARERLSMYREFARCVLASPFLPPPPAVSPPPARFTTSLLLLLLLPSRGIFVYAHCTISTL